MKGWCLPLITVVLSLISLISLMPLSLSPCALAARPAVRPLDRAGDLTFRADLVEPGKTQTTQLKALLGQPVRVVRESPRHEFYFYDLGEGSTMDATLSVRNGVVEYMSYLCSDSIKDVHAKFSGEPSIQRTVSAAGSGYASSLTQVLYEGRGRGYLYEPRSLKIRACMAWEPGHKFE